MRFVKINQHWENNEERVDVAGAVMQSYVLPSEFILLVSTRVFSFYTQKLEHHSDVRLKDIVYGLDYFV